MTGRHTRLVVLTVLAVAVARTPSDALQETPTLQQITEMHIRADAGDAAAQVTLGGWYFAGSGMPQDTDEGVRWWRQAAEQGHLPAQTGLGGGVQIDDGAILGGQVGVVEHVPIGAQARVGAQSGRQTLNNPTQWSKTPTVVSHLSQTPT